MLVEKTDAQEHGDRASSLSTGLKVGLPSQNTFGFRRSCESRLVWQVFIRTTSEKLISVFKASKTHLCGKRSPSPWALISVGALKLTLGAVAADRAWRRL